MSDINSDVVEVLKSKYEADENGKYSYEDISEAYEECVEVLKRIEAVVPPSGVHAKHMALLTETFPNLCR